MAARLGGRNRAATSRRQVELVSREFSCCRAAGRLRAKQSCRELLPSRVYRLPNSVCWFFSTTSSLLVAKERKPFLRAAAAAGLSRRRPTRSPTLSDSNNSPTTRLESACSPPTTYLALLCFALNLRSTCAQPTRPAADIARNSLPPTPALPLRALAGGARGAPLAPLDKSTRNSARRLKAQSRCE